MKKYITQHESKDCLATYIPLEKKAFFDSQAFDLLAVAVYNYQMADAEDKPETRQAFLHAKANFDNFCQTLEMADGESSSQTENLQDLR